MDHDLTRQEQVFDTSQLKSARVAIAGTGPISNFLCAYLAGLGAGNIVLVDNTIRRRPEPKEFLSELSRKIDPKCNNIRETVNRINPETDLIPYFSIPNRQFTESCTVFIDTTNDPDSKYVTARHAEQAQAFFISCSSTETAASISVNNQHAGRRPTIDDLLLPEYRGFDQGSFTSGLAAALAADEIRKTVCTIDHDRPLAGRLNYSLFDPLRFSSGRLYRRNVRNSTRTRKVLEKARGKRALVVGAGGIGTYTLLNLVMLGIDIDLYDHDIIESHNLNRQLLHYGAIGNNKAEEAAAKLRRINPKTRVEPHTEMITKQILQRKRVADDTGHEYDLVFSCVDSWKTRRDLNTYCRETATPLFNGGVSTFGCLIDHYIPGNMHCLECSNDYRRRIEEESRPTSCASLEANVVMPNAIAGALIVGESLQAIAPDKVPALHDRMIRYESNIHPEKKFFLEKIRKHCENPRYYRHDCRCHRHMGVEDYD